MVLDAIYNYGVKDHMNTRKLFYHKETRGDVIVEMLIWQFQSIERLVEYFRIDCVRFADWEW